MYGRSAHAGGIGSSPQPGHSRHVTFGMCTNRTAGRHPTHSTIAHRYQLRRSMCAHAAPRRVPQGAARRGLRQFLCALCPRRRLGHLTEMTRTRAQARVVLCSQRTHSGFKSPNSRFLPSSSSSLGSSSSPSLLRRRQQLISAATRPFCVNTMRTVLNTTTDG